MLQTAKCPLYPQNFQSYLQINKHIEDEHYHNCMACDKTFANEQTLMTHMKKYHEDEEPEPEYEESIDEESGGDVEEVNTSNAESDPEEEISSADEGSRSKAEVMNKSDGDSPDDTFTYDDVRAILRYHRQLTE